MPRRETSELDALSDEALATLKLAESDVGHDQGTTLASWLRDRLGFTDAQAVEPRELLRRWRVQGVRLDLEVSFESMHSISERLLVRSELTFPTGVVQAGRQ